MVATVVVTEAAVVVVAKEVEERAEEALAAATVVEEPRVVGGAERVRLEADRAATCPRRHRDRWRPSRSRSRSRPPWPPSWLLKVSRLSTSFREVWAKRG